MAVDEAAVNEAKRLLQNPLQKIAARELESRGGLAALRSAIRDLRGLADNALQSLASKVPALVESIIKGPASRAVKQSSAELAALLFGKMEQSTAATLEEAMYKQQLGQLSDFLQTAAFDSLIQDPRQFQTFEKLAAVLFERQAHRLDRYAALRVESDAYNQLVKGLFPKDFPSLRVDDHHIIEARTYDKFKATWQLLGWQSSDDMVAVGLMYQLHIRSPKKLLPDVDVWVANEEDVASLTTLLLRSIDLAKINSADALLDAYESFYRTTKIWSYVAPALRAVRTEIRRQETLAKGFKRLKSL